MEVCLVSFEPLDIRIECPKGSLLSDIAFNAGVELVSVCGNQGLCGKCLVRILNGLVSPPTEAEGEHLDPLKIAQGYRLACQTRVLQDVRVLVPQESYQKTRRLEISGIEGPVSFEPVVQEYSIDLSLPSLQDPRSDWTRLKEELTRRTGRQGIFSDLTVMRRMPGLLRENGWRLRVSLRGREMIDLRPPDKNPLGLALDIGTTKIAAYLVDMENGRTSKVLGVTNPQMVYGEDVMSRIGWAVKDQGTRLHQSLVSCLNRLIQKLGPEPDRIVEAVIVGNTAMHLSLIHI